MPPKMKRTKSMISENTSQKMAMMQALNLSRLLKNKWKRQD